MSTSDDWAIEEDPDMPRPWIVLWDSSYTDGPNFYSAEEIERFIEQLRAASQRVFGPAPAADELTDEELEAVLYAVHHMIHSSGACFPDVPKSLFLKSAREKLKR